LTVPGRGALVSELIALAGGASVTADAPVPYPRYSIEAAVASAPEIIVLARHGAGQGAIARERWERFTQLPAIRAGRLHASDGNLLHRYGPRMVDGLEALARIIHPGVLAEASAR
jgi:iron complex transport system substrate-binding protein